MATSGDILIVRNNTNEGDDTSEFTSDFISALIDEQGVVGASATIWESKTAQLVEEVDVTEAGASHKFSDLFVHAKQMSEYWRKKADVIVVSATTGRVRVKVINRQ
jgi:hypothetical protein